MTGTYPFKLIAGDHMTIANAIATGRYAAGIFMVIGGGDYVG